MHCNNVVDLVHVVRIFLNRFYGKYTNKVLPNPFRDLFMNLPANELIICK